MSNKHLTTFIVVSALILATYLFWTLIFVFNPVFYQHLQQRVGVEQFSFNQPIISYFLSPSFDVADIPSLTLEENSHIHDVKNIIYATELVFAFLFFFLFFIHVHFTLNTFRTTGIMIVFIPLIFLFIPFDALFTQFHYIIFPQGNWQFDPATTTLVNIYPAAFFQQFFQTIISFSTVTGVVFIILARTYALKHRYLTTTNI